MKNILILFLLLGFLNLNARSYQHNLSIERYDNIQKQYNLGMRYKDGYRMQQNLKEAFKWFHKSALKGYLPAQYEFALMFHYGNGVRQNRELARLWFTRAAKKGDFRSQTILHRFYSGPRPLQMKQGDYPQYSRNFRTMR